MPVWGDEISWMKNTGTAQQAAALVGSICLFVGIGLDTTRVVLEFVPELTAALRLNLALACGLVGWRWCQLTPGIRHQTRMSSIRLAVSGFLSVSE